MIRPLGKNILVRKVKNEEKTNVILLATSNKSGPYRAEIIEVGFDSDIDVYEGNIVLVNQYAGIKIDESDEDLVLIKEIDILGVIDA